MYTVSGSGASGRPFDIVAFTAGMNPDIDDFGGGGERRQGMIASKAMYV